MTTVTAPAAAAAPEAVAAIGADEAAGALAERMFGGVIATMEMLTVHLGWRFGFYEQLRTPHNAGELAAATGILPRYVREWCEQQATAGFLDVDLSIQQKYHVPIFVGEFGCARYAPGAEAWLGDQIDLYEQYGWSWAYWAFREWDVMNIERTADATDKANHADTPLLRLFKNYFARDKRFFTAE